MTGVHQEVLILHRLMAVHSSPVLEVTLFYSGWQLCRYSPQGGHGNLLRSNVPRLHVYLWNTGDRALSILNAVLIKFSSWQHYDHYDLCYITTWPFDLHQLHLCLMWRLSLRARLRCVIVQQLPEERATSSSFCTSPSFLSESKHASSPSLKSAIDLKWYWDGLPIGLLLPYSQHRWSSETSDHTTAKEWKVRDKTKTANIIIYCCVIKLFGVEDTFLFKLTHFFSC